MARPGVRAVAGRPGPRRRVLSPRSHFAGLLGLAAVAGCYGPTLADGQYSCDPASSAADNCPSGYSCSTCGICRAGGAQADDRPSCPSGCTNNNGQRAPGDPGLPGVAFCLGAWSVPGVTTPASMSPQCGGRPGANGQACSVADNCATGWHVCLGDADAKMSGLDGGACKNGPPGFFVTRQIGCAGLPKPIATIAGCGALGDQGGCNGALSTVLRSCPMGWTCPVSNVGAGITASTTAHGGVLCCKG